MRIKYKPCEHYKRFSNFDSSRRTNTETSIEFPYTIYVYICRYIFHRKAFIILAGCYKYNLTPIALLLRELPLLPRAVLNDTLGLA